MYHGDFGPRRDTGGYYNLFLGVAKPVPAEGTGQFTMEVDYQVKEPGCTESLPGISHTQWPPEVTVLPLTDGSAITTGALASGSCVNLDWAEQSSVACFPGTRFHHFQGNHVYFALDTPIQGAQTVTVTATPWGPGKDISLYGYLSGGIHVPPYVPSVLQCEARYPLNITSEGNPGAPESSSFSPTNNGIYNLFFAVAGADSALGLNGKFNIDVTVQSN